MNKLNEAQKKLEQCFVDLEDVILGKIDQIKQEQICIEDLDENRQNIIKTLNEEINFLQKSLSELGSENENLIKENKQLSQEIRQIKLERSKIVDQIKVDLNSIKQIINTN